MKRYRESVELTERQIDLLHQILDSYQEGRAMGGGNGVDPDGVRSPAYRAADKFCLVLQGKLTKAIAAIERRQRTDLMVKRARSAILGVRK